MSLFLFNFNSLSDCILSFTLQLVTKYFLRIVFHALKYSFLFSNIIMSERRNRSTKVKNRTICYSFAFLLLFYFIFFVLRLVLLLLIIISTFISTTRLCVFIVLLMGSNRMPKAAIRLAWKNNVRFLYEQNSFQILQWFIFLLPFIR